MDLIASKGIVWADIQDAAGALVAIISDPNINGTQDLPVSFLLCQNVSQNSTDHSWAFVGRSFAILPRKWAPRGYLDIDRDDVKEGEPLKEWQDLLLSLGDELSNLN